MIIGYFLHMIINEVFCVVIPKMHFFYSINITNCYVEYCCSQELARSQEHGHD